MTDTTGSVPGDAADDVRPDPASAPPEEPGSDLGEDIDGQLQMLDPDDGAQPGDDDGEAGEPA
ncbi:hypothetical protein ELQ90_09745 [Labedella phragmitis]|jgi:hypothetical protein|uniref:Uncharacterized protein n=1 Tax=Labedella phragmitis TaxID=2498849 RepID=A0A3S4DG97_9MICO|nr:hypothetical protein [Labedella phragmitis]RWZ51068.1 hypothetical protein ELQ90_09745 [Labedella phragmitis]